MLIPGFALTGDAFPPSPLGRARRQWTSRSSAGRRTPNATRSRRIVVATDRPVGFREARNQPRTMDYPFTSVKIRLDKNDKGQGKILAGTRLLIDKNNHLVLENYGQQPVRFNEIRRLK